MLRVSAPALLLVTCVLGLSACVTETRVNGQQRNDAGAHVDKETAAKTRVSLALRYLEAGDAEQARRNLDLAVQLAPKLTDVYVAQGFFFNSVGQRDRAETAYQQALRLSPRDGDVMNNYGVMLCQHGEFERAEKLFNQALSNPDYVEVAATNENAGLCAVRQGEPEKALQYFNAALAYNLNRPASLLGASEILIAQNKFSQARVYLERYDSIAEQTPRSLFAWVLLENGADNFAAEARWGMELQQRFPNAIQTKRYIANEY